MNCATLVGGNTSQGSSVLPFRAYSIPSPTQDPGRCAEEGEPCSPGIGWHVVPFLAGGL